MYVHGHFLGDQKVPSEIQFSSTKIVLGLVLTLSVLPGNGFPQLQGSRAERPGQRWTHWTLTGVKPDCECCYTALAPYLNGFFAIF